MGKTIKIKGTTVLTEDSKDLVPIIEYDDIYDYYEGKETTKKGLYIVTEGSYNPPDPGYDSVEFVSDALSGTIEINNNTINLANCSIHMDYLSDINSEFMRACEVNVSITNRIWSEEDKRHIVATYPLFQLVHNSNTRGVPHSSVNDGEHYYCGGSDTLVKFGESTFNLIKYYNVDLSDLGLSPSDIQNGDYDAVISVTYMNQNELNIQHTYVSDNTGDTYRIQTGLQVMHTFITGGNMYDFEKTESVPILIIQTETPQRYKALRWYLDIDNEMHSEGSMTILTMDYSFRDDRGSGVTWPNVEFQGNGTYAFFLLIDCTVSSIFQGYHHDETFDVRVLSPTILANITPMQDMLVSNFFDLSYTTNDSYSEDSAFLTMTCRVPITIPKSIVLLESITDTYIYEGTEGISHRHYTGWLNEGVSFERGTELRIEDVWPQIFDNERPNRPTESKNIMFDYILNLNTDLCTMQVYNYFPTFEEEVE